MLVLTTYLAKVISHQIEYRGVAVLEPLQLELQEEQYWRDFFHTIISGIPRIWVTIAAVSCLSVFLMS